jgi:hypothetical protein
MSGGLERGATRNIENIQRMRSAKRLRKNISNHFRDGLQMLLGVLSAGFGLRSFLMRKGKWLWQM